MSPRTPSSISAFIARAEGSKRKCWAVISFLPDLSRAAIISRTRSGVGASGFSQITCFPASRAATASGAWCMLGTHMSAMSISGSENSSSGASYSLETPCSSPQERSTVASISDPATTSAWSEARHPGMWDRDIPPTPMIPTFSAAIPPPLSQVADGAEIKRMAGGVSTVRSRIARGIPGGRESQRRRRPARRSRFFLGEACCRWTMTRSPGCADISVAATYPSMSKPSSRTVYPTPARRTTVASRSAP